MAIAIGLGMPGINALLVASQVVLSIVLPFIISPLLYCTSKKAIMTVCKTRTGAGTGAGMIVEDATPEVRFSVDDVPASPVRDSSTAERAVTVVVEVMDSDSGEIMKVDYSNNKLVIVIGVVSWLIIVMANVYVIVELGLGGHT